LERRWETVVLPELDPSIDVEDVECHPMIYLLGVIGTRGITDNREIEMAQLLS
jgi:hypothetical protein